MTNESPATVSIGPLPPHLECWQDLAAAIAAALIVSPATGVPGRPGLPGDAPEVTPSPVYSLVSRDRRIETLIPAGVTTTFTVDAPNGINSRRLRYNLINAGTKTISRIEFPADTRAILHFSATVAGDEDAAVEMYWLEEELIASPVESG